jgi:heterogeneous nuclear ribonucleoprotein R
LTKDKKTKENKGFAFVTFADKDAAQCAVMDVQDREYKVLRLTKMLNLLHNLHRVSHSAMFDTLTCHDLVVQGRTLGCSLSQAKHRLFVGNVPKGLSEEELTNIIKGKGPGVVNIEMFKVRCVILWGVHLYITSFRFSNRDGVSQDQHGPNRNRGFLFVEYYNHACADYGRQNLSSSNFKVYGSQLTVRWAEPKGLTDASCAASQVQSPSMTNFIFLKILFVHTSLFRPYSLILQHAALYTFFFCP